MISPSYSSWKRSGCPGNDVVSTRVFSQQMPVSIGSALHRTLNCFNWFQVCELCDCQCRMDASHCNLVSPILTEQTRQKYLEVKWHTLKSLNCCKVKGTCSFDHPQVNFGSTSISCGWSDCPVILAHFWCGSGKSTSPIVRNSISKPKISGSIYVTVQSFQAWETKIWGEYPIKSPLWWLKSY